MLGTKGHPSSSSRDGDKEEESVLGWFASQAFQNLGANISYTADGGYSGLRFNLPFIHMLMRSSAALSRSCWWIFPNPFLSRDEPCKGYKWPWLPPCPTTKSLGPRAGGRCPPSADPHRFRLARLLRAVHFCALEKQACCLMRDNHWLLPC